MEKKNLTFFVKNPFCYPDARCLHVRQVCVLSSFSSADLEPCVAKAHGVDKQGAGFAQPLLWLSSLAWSLSLGLLPPCLFGQSIQTL
jgi:hypothetical protein